MLVLPPDVAALRFLNLLDDAAWRANPAVLRAFHAEGLDHVDHTAWRAQLGSRDPAEREAMAHRLLRLRERLVRRLLIALSAEQRTVSHVLREFIDLFTATMPDQDLRITPQHAIEALIPLQDAAVDGLAVALHGANEPEQVIILNALRRIGSAAESALPALLGALDAPSASIREAAKGALMAVGASALPRLITLTGHASADLRSAAAEVAGGIAAAHPDPIERRRAIEALLHGLYDQHAAMRQASAISLGQIGTAHPESIVRIASALLPLLADRDLRVREAVQHSFTQMGDPVVPILSGALASRSEDIRRAAREALDRIRE